jgi:purine catabolism regulator
MEAFEGSRTACGLGTEKPLLEAPASLMEAQVAAVASSLLCDSKAVRYEEMGADRLLVLLYLEHPAELGAFVADTLGPILLHEAEAATPLLPTLEAFVAHGGRLRETAAAMYVHRNTLAYRLDRAAEILKVDLREPRVRLAIEMALRALRLVGRQEGKQL